MFQPTYFDNVYRNKKQTTQALLMVPYQIFGACLESVFMSISHLHVKN